MQIVYFSLDNDGHAKITEYQSSDNKAINAKGFNFSINGLCVIMVFYSL